MNSRPHPTPCACQECVEWAKSIVSAPAERKRNSGPPAAFGAAPEMPLAEFARRMVAMACKATGLNEYEIRERAKAMDLEPLEVPPQRDSRQVVADRGVPEKHLRSVYDREPVDCQALTAVRDFLASDKTSLVLAGGTGTRKSGSACWALTHRPGVFMTEDEAIRLQSSRDPEDIAAWKRARQAQVLILDDVGEYSDDKGWGIKVVTGLWNHRYSSELKFIVTANMTAAEFKSAFGERIVDRVRESGRFVEIRGQSARRAG